MTIELNKKLADAICTTVTLGFMQRETAKTGVKTKFAFEKNDEKEMHEKLAARINSLSDKQIVSFQQMDDKLVQPFVIAQTKKMNEDNRAGFADLINHRNKLVQLLSNKNNRPVPFYGAYISGCINGNNTVELSETSSLKLYKRPDGSQGWRIEGLENRTVMNSYNAAKDTTNAINKFLYEHLTEHNSFNDIKFRLSQEHSPEPQIFQENYLFGSIHGLVNAIIRYNLTDSGVGSDTLATCCELALSDDTTKVASCIPCSIFASSNNTPAPYTHLGRGDNWNLPDPLEGLYNFDIKKKQWEKYVTECFSEGYVLLCKKLNKQLQDLSAVAELSTDRQKAEIFLHSLTFEDKFINRMNNTFNILNI